MRPKHAVTEAESRGDVVSAAEVFVPDARLLPFDLASIRDIRCEVAYPPGLMEAEEPDIQLLSRFAPCQAYIDWIHEVVDRDYDDFKIGIDLEDLGFIHDYLDMARVLGRHGRAADMVVVDVGCSTGLQHVLFQHFKGYIGIDQHKADAMKVFTPNASLIQGSFADLVESGQFKIEPDMVGIANMSILYCGGAGNEVERRNIEAFNQFHRKIIL